MRFEERFRRDDDGTLSAACGFSRVFSVTGGFGSSRITGALSATLFSTCLVGCDLFVGKVADRVTRLVATRVAAVS